MARAAEGVSLRPELLRGGGIQYLRPKALPRREITHETYQHCKKTFANDIHNGQVLYHLELNRYHVLNVDYIIPFEHLFPTERPDGTERRLSTFDALIIAMGMELARITGGETYVVSCDRRIAEVIRILGKLRREERQAHGVPEYVHSPASITSGMQTRSGFYLRSSAPN